MQLERLVSFVVEFSIAIPWNRAPKPTRGFRVFSSSNLFDTLAQVESKDKSTSIKWGIIPTPCSSLVCALVMIVMIIRNRSSINKKPISQKSFSDGICRVAWLESHSFSRSYKTISTHNSFYNLSSYEKVKHSCKMHKLFSSYCNSCPT